ALEPTFGSGKIGEALGMAARIASSAGTEVVSTIYLISDLQMSGCKDLAEHPLPPGLEVKIIPTADVVNPNCAITELQLDGRDADKPHVVVANFSDEPAKPVNIKLAIDGKDVLTRQLEFATGNVGRAELG